MMVSMVLTRSPSRALLILLALPLACAEQDKPELAVRSAALLDESLAQALAGNEVAPIIVNLRVDDRGDRTEVDAISAAQESLLGRGISGFSLSRRYRHVPALAGRASRSAVEQLVLDPAVSFVQYDQPGDGQLKEAVPAIGGDLARTELGLTGRGVRVAVLDTGIDTDHPDLRDALIAQHCFTQFACPPFGSEGASAEDDHGHGSNVAGIIASDGVVSPRGFAPEAELVVVKINDANDSGQESDWIAGMDWVFDNLTTQKVKIVNLSIGTTALYVGGQAECDRAHPAMARAIKNLVDAGVTVFAATGNRGSSSSMAAPACNSGVIAVGAVYDSSAGRQPPLAVGNSYNARWGASFAACNDANSAFDQIACFTNSTARMDLLAPGAPIVSDSLRGRTEMYWGTSQAAPVAAGVAALMLQCNPSLTPAQIKQAMVSTGVPRTDTRNGLSFPSLRALAAVKAVCKEESELDGGALDSGAVGATDAGDMLSEAGSVAGDAGGSMLGAGSANSDAASQALPPGEAGIPTSSEPQAKTNCDCALTGLEGARRRPTGLCLGLAMLLTLQQRRRRRARR